MALAARLARLAGIAGLACVGCLPCLAGGCSSNHSVSPFPPMDASPLFAPRRDLGAQLERVSAEAGQLGLREAVRVEGQLRPDDPFVALGFEGADTLGRRVTAVRIVTSAGVVLALGPPPLAGDRPDEPRLLLRFLEEAGAYPSGSDLNGDGAPDVALATDDGELAIYRIDLLGAARYPVTMVVRPTRALDVNGDGRPDLTGSAPTPTGDPLAPDLSDVAIATPQGYASDHPDAIAFHARLARAAQPPRSAPPAERLRRALERAHHAALSGATPDEAFQPVAELAAELAPLPDPLASAWVRWRGHLADALAAHRAARRPLPTGSATPRNHHQGTRGEEPPPVGVERRASVPAAVPAVDEGGAVGRGSAAGEVAGAVVELRDDAGLALVRDARR
jgi:hypothetical protein